MENHKSNNTKEDFYISNEENEDNIFKINNSKYVKINSDLQHKRRLISSEINETNDPYIKKEPRSRKYYNKFINGIQKSKSNIKSNKDNEEMKEEGNDKFINIVNKMMDQIMIKNNSIRNTIKTPKNKKSNSYERKKTFSYNYIENEYLKFILLIQKKYRQYKNKKVLYKEILNEKEQYLSINDIKILNKNELEIELIKYMNKNKNLFDIIKYYKYKMNLIENENKRLKEKIKHKNRRKIEQNNSKENKAILRNTKNIDKTSKKKVTILDKKDGDIQINKYNNNEIINNIKILKNQKDNNKDDNDKLVNNHNNDNNNIDKNNENLIKNDNKNENNNNNNEKQNGQINNNEKQNEQNNNNENKVVDEDPIAKKERLKKSRGLRKILTKKVKEKKEILKKYFTKFYLHGLYASIKLGIRRRTHEIKQKRNRSVEQRRGTMFFDNKIFLDFSVNYDESIEEIDQSKNEKNKRIQLLTKIIYRKDRVQTLIMKKTFEKLNLRAKLMSLEQNKKERLAKSKIKKKGRHKSKSLSSVNLGNFIGNRNSKKD